MLSLSGPHQPADGYSLGQERPHSQIRSFKREDWDGWRGALDRRDVRRAQAQVSKLDFRAG
jgi:hypothetical protein